MRDYIYPQSVNMIPEMFYTCRKLQKIAQQSPGAPDTVDGQAHVWQ